MRIWIDVGAYHGEYTLKPALENQDLTVYAFEPGIEQAAALSGQAPNYIVMPFAVSDVDGLAKLHINNNGYQNSLLPFDGQAQPLWIPAIGAVRTLEIREVKTVRLDSFLNQSGIAQVEWLKVDTQGNDLAVLRGCGERIRDIGKVTVEVDVAAQRCYLGSAPKEEFLNFLSAAGFRLVTTQKQTSDLEENLTFERIP
jgi:FkbM family methyltransferase